MIYQDGEDSLLLHLLKNDSVDYIIDNCSSNNFSHPFKKQVFEIIKNFVLNGTTSVNFASVRNVISNASENHLQYLDALYKQPFEVYPDVEYSIKKVIDLGKRRRLNSVIQNTLSNINNEEINADELIDNIEDSLMHVDPDTNKLDVVLPSELLERRQKGLKERYYSKGVYSGWPDFDQFLSVGFAPGKLSVIAGRTSMGKSFFKTNIIINMCSNDIGVINVCPEQGLTSEHDRIDSIMTGISLNDIVRIREMDINDPNISILKENTEKIVKEWNYACVPSRDTSVADIKRAIRRVKRAGLTPDIVFVDLFDRLTDVNVPRDRVANIAKKLGEIERIAEEEQIHVCLLVQINRGPENRSDKRPTLGDLRESGHFEQDADLILMLYREGYYNRDLNDNVLDIEIAKQRDGVKGTIYQFLITHKQTLLITPMGEKERT